MFQVAGDQPLRVRSNSAFEKPVIVLVLRACEAWTWRELHRDTLQRREQLCRLRVKRRELCPEQDIAIFGPDCIRQTKRQAPAQHQLNHERLKSIGLEACRNQDVGIEHDSHG